MNTKLAIITALALTVAASPALRADTNESKCPSSKASMAKKTASMKKDQGPDIVDTAVKAGSFKTLVAAVKAAGLVDALKSDKRLTVFAPTDAAFAKLPKGTVESLLKPENKDQLINILTYHVVEGEVAFKDAVGIDEAIALNDQTLALSLKNGGLYLNDSKVVNNDIKTSNGIIHVIDSVLLPPKSAEPTSPVEKIISSAIDRGVPLFNHGQEGACADLYELAAEAILVMGPENVDAKVLSVLSEGLAAADKTWSKNRRAWAMRNALDKAMTLVN